VAFVDVVQMRSVTILLLERHMSYMLWTKVKGDILYSLESRLNVVS
jgi:hypothetical protein